MRLNYLLPFLITLITIYSSYSQQITTDDSLPLEQLIQESLGQSCVEISDISSSVNGVSHGFNSFGYFERNNSNFPFANGILLTTGSVNSAGNMMNTNPLNEGHDSWLTDSDLENALGITNTQNATSIQFNFTSIANQIQFNYLLASEEYQQEFPCFYSDGFAFLIREAGSTGPYTNIALVPGTSTPVNTNTIHDEIEGFCTAENDTFFDGYSLGDTNYDGRTTVLTATATILPSVEYEIKLIIADQTDNNFDSAVFIEGNSFNANGIVDLGPDISTCGNSVTLNGDIQNPQAVYAWYQNNTLIAGEDNPTLEALSSGTYNVQITIPLNTTSCVIEDTIVVTLDTEQSADDISDMVYCYDDVDNNIGTFDLSTKNNDVLAAVPPSSYSISYHYTSEDAENGINPITTPIQNTSSPQAIYVKIEDTINGCLAYSTFNLVVNEKPVYVDPDPITVCEDPSLNGYTFVDLSIANDQIINGNSNLEISYYFSQTEAELDSNPIASPYENFNTSQTLYVRVYDNVTGCFSTTTIDILFQEKPTINTEIQWINACEQDEDGFEVFDLTSIIDNVLQGVTGLNVSYHITEFDALNNLNAISNPENYQNTIPNFQMVYIRIQDPTTGCYTVTNIELYANIIKLGFLTDPFIVCDDTSNDGIADFDLNEVETNLINGYEGYEISFYTTEEDRENGINIVDKNPPFNVINNGTIIYVIAADDSCIEFIDLTLEIAPAIILVPTTVDYCDEDDNGFTSILMETFDSAVSQSTQPVNVTYYLTEDDAIDNLNILPNYVNNTTNPQLFHVRVTDALSGCFDISTVEINILSAPIIMYPESIIICDDDQDGISNINLDAKIPEIVTSTAGLDITFYNNLDAANNGENEINTTDNYFTESVYIYARVENELTGCYSLSGFDVIINTQPEFVPISNFENCEEAIIGVADFYLNLKDNEILNGQLDKQVLYYETEADAIAGTNVIDKYSIYNNTSNPQTIYTRVESITDSDCFGTSSFELEVGSIPIFNAATAIFVCDDISNDGIVTVDLNEKITEIITGSPENLDVTFFTSALDAENNNNQVPLIYTNTTNPQVLFARVDNGNYCKGISSFNINIISAPTVTLPTPLERCDDNYDGVLTWDLTDAETEFLGARQVNIEISYFETIEDLEADLNAIPDPENYDNISNPQTIYIKINNTVSHCFISVPLDLITNLPPQINDFESFEICDNPTSSFDLTTINEVIVDTNYNVLFSYFSSEADAIANQNSLDTNYNYTSTNDMIYARVEFSTTHCSFVYPFQLLVNPLPIANQPPNLTACDDNYDSYFDFNLNEQNSFVLGFQNPTDYSVTYFNTISDAEEGANTINSDSYNGFNNEIITARIENNTTGCYQLVNFSLIVNRKPFVAIPDQVVCTDNLPLVVSAETYFTTDTYLWSTNETASSIEITEIGEYSVTVTSEFGCVSMSTFNVTESESAYIELTETVDFSDPNNITITVSGSGNYLYILNDGVPQQSNIFENVRLGYNTIRIIDLNGCADTTKEVLVIDAPKFFTPNSDRKHDTWHIVGIETLPGSIIYIFNRQGKLITQLSANTPGWDGTLNGYNLPASDYWFSAEIKQDNKAFKVQGHFALRR
ncbi:T9SS type B sorting domain-containing protein [Winogradskyella ludwigii]|uniref:T9SS type B sorting domain-containing protein n=1 Tax=Winogradskyella ludwigii TaxID=2686076 RepID=UPI0015CD2C80|nr:T9SS type B sorting domain-containing protein [Winogradskyella ludwigii]